MMATSNNMALVALLTLFGLTIPMVSAFWDMKSDVVGANKQLLYAPTASVLDAGKREPVPVMVSMLIPSQATQRPQPAIQSESVKNILVPDVPSPLKDVPPIKLEQLDIDEASEDAIAAKMINQKTKEHSGFHNVGRILKGLLAGSIG